MIALVFKNLTKHKVRFTLTVLSLAVAVFLICVLRSLVVTLDAGVRAAATNRIVVQSAVSLFVNLPESYQGKIRGVEGVEQALKLQWFGGFFQDQSNFFAQFGTDAEDFLDVYDEVKLIEGSREDFVRNRQACLVGKDLIERFGDQGFELGATIPIIGALYPRLDGTPWQFQIAGVYESTSSNVDDNTLWFHYDYLAESLEGGSADGPEGVGVYVVQVQEGHEPVQVMASIDGLFENGPQRVQSTSEAEFQAQFVSMIGNVPMFVSSIGGGVTLAVLLAVLNTMLMAGREQRRDTGVLKALGFTDGQVAGVLLGQALVLVLLGGGLGIALAKVSEPGIVKMLGTMFPGFAIQPDVLGLAAAVTAGIGVLAGILPALQAARLEVVDALRED